MKHRLLSLALSLLFAISWGGCEQTASGSHNSNSTLTGPSTDEAAKTDNPIRILSGQLVDDPSIAPLPLIDVKGTRSFRLSSTFEGSLGPVDSCSPCAPGDPVRLDSRSVGLDVRGTVTLHGKTYGGIGQGDPGLDLQFKGEGFIAPPFTDAATAEMSAPFTFSGTFSYPPDASMPSVTELTGSGIATVRLRKLVFGPELELAVWEVAATVFDFTK